MILINPYVFGGGGGGGGGPAPTFVTGSSDVTYTNSDRTVLSVSGWSVIPLSAPIPTSGKWYVEYDTTGLTGHQMIGLFASGAVDAGHYLGDPSSVASGVSKGDGSRLNGAVFSWVDTTDFSTSGTTSVGTAVDMGTGHLRWYVNGALQATDASFTSGASGIYFAVGSFSGRGVVTLKLAAAASIPSGYSYLA